MTTPDPLFAPTDIGITADTWDQLTTTPAAPRCHTCGRPLRSQQSKDAHIGPGCAAKIGRAVIRREVQ